MVLAKTLESPLDYKEIKLVHPKGHQPWIFFGRTDAKAETPILWSPDAKNWLTGKDPDAGKDWRQEEKGMTEDEMVGWHHWLKGHESEQALGDGDGQGSLACCSPWSHKESDMIEQLNNNNKYYLKLHNLIRLNICGKQIMEGRKREALFFKSSTSSLRFIFFSIRRLFERTT